MVKPVRGFGSNLKLLQTFLKILLPLFRSGLLGDSGEFETFKSLSEDSYSPFVARPVRGFGGSLKGYEVHPSPMLPLLFGDSGVI